MLYTKQRLGNPTTYYRTFRKDIVVYKSVIIIIFSIALSGVVCSAMEGHVADGGYHGAMVLKKTAEQKDWLIADRLVVSVRSAESLMTMKGLSSPQKHEVKRIFASAWASALTTASEFHTAGAESHVFKQWKSDLTRASNIPAMAWALAISGADEKYFTDGLKQEFNQTTNISVLKSLSFWIYKWGNDLDITLMKNRADKLDKQNNLNLEHILNIALTYRIAHKHSKPGHKVMVSASTESPWPGDPFASETASVEKKDSKLAAR